MTWRSDFDYISDAKRYRDDSLEREIKQLTRENSALREKIAVFEKKEADKIKQAKDEETLRLAKEQSLTDYFLSCLKAKNDRVAIFYAKKNDAMSKLADLIEISLEKKPDDELENFLFEVYEELKPENTPKFEKRCIDSINAIEASIKEQKNNNNNEDAVNSLLRKKLKMYIKLYQGFKNTKDGGVDLESICNLLFNPIDTFEKFNQKNVRSFEELVVELALQLQDVKKEIKSYQTNPVLAKLLSELKTPDEKLELLTHKLTTASNANASLCSNNKNLSKRNVELDEQNSELLAKNQQLTEELFSAKSILDTTDHKKQRLENDNTKLADNIDQLSSENKKIKSENSELLAQQKNLEQKIKMLEAANKNMHVKIQQTSQDCQNKASLIANFQEQLQSTQSENLKLRISNQSLRQQLKLANNEIIAEIKEDVGSFEWKTSGNDLIGEKSVTSTAKKIHTTITQYEKSEDNRENSDIKCIKKIREIATKGAESNFLYRFFFRQNESSRARYRDYLDILDNNAVSLKKS